MRVSLARQCIDIPYSTEPEGRNNFCTGFRSDIGSRRFFSYFGNTASLPQPPTPLRALAALAASDIESLLGRWG